MAHQQISVRRPICTSDHSACCTECTLILQRLELRYAVPLCTPSAPSLPPQCADTPRSTSTRSRRRQTGLRTTRLDPRSSDMSSLSWRSTNSCRTSVSATS